jgi:Flp pilus assembly protein TadD
MAEDSLETSIPSSQSMLSVAKAEIKGGLARQAVADLRQYLARAPDDPEAHELLGIALEKCHLLSEALDELHKATTLAPNRASAHFNLALLLLKMGELDEAVAEQQTALYLEPGYQAAQRLSEVLMQRVRDRAYRASDGECSVGGAPDRLAANPVWANLPCPMCGAMNFMTSRTCGRCGNLIPEMPDVRAME